MQFGRIDDACFALDAAFPLSPCRREADKCSAVSKISEASRFASQAFSIALAVFDNRLYEALRIYY